MEQVKKKGRVGLNLTEGNIWKTLLVFAVPILLANLVQQLYNAVDLIIIGKSMGNTGTVGVAQGGEFVNMLTMLSIGFSGAGQVYVSQLVGARETEKVRHCIGTLLTIMVLGSTVFGITGAAVSRPFLRMMNCPEEALEQAVDYMIITCLGCPFVFGYNAVCSVLRGMGESRRPLLFVSIAAVSNIFLDLFFVVVLKMEAAGTAWATILAQFISFAASIIFMYKKKEHFGFDFKLESFKVRREPLKVLIRLGIPKSLSSCLINVSLLYCTSHINAYGIVASATNSVGNKITRFANIITQSIDTGAAAMVGQCLGAKKNDRARAAVHVSLAIAMSMAVFNSALAIFCPKFIFGIFTNEAEVIEFGVTFMRISIITFFLSSFMGPFQAMLTGSGAAGLSFLVGILDGVVLRIGISIILAGVFHMDEKGYFLGNALARLAPCIIGAVYFYSNAWQRRKLLTEG